MTAQSAVSLPRPATQLARWSAVGLIGLLSAAALLVAWRRLLGALNDPLPAGVLAGVGLATAATAAAARLGLRAPRTARRCGEIR